MGHFFGEPRGERIATEVAQMFREGAVFVNRKEPFLFVCGGALTQNNLRGKFLKYAEQGLQNWRYFLAEKTYEALIDDSNQFINLADLEKFMSDIADCILIFPESPGSFAEIGYFSAYPELNKKTLVANKFEHQSKNSFLNRGPIHTVVRQSVFGGAAYVVNSGESGEVDFEPIRELLTEHIKLRRRKRIEDLTALGPKERFLFALYLLSLFPPLKPVDLSMLFVKLFGKSDYREIRRILSLLTSAGYIEYSAEVDRYTGGKIEHMPIDIEGRSHSDIKSFIINQYQKHAPELLKR